MLGAQSPYWRLSAWKYRLDRSPIEAVNDPDLGLVLVDSERGKTLVMYGEPSRGVPALQNLLGQGIVPARTMMNREIYGALDADLRNHFGPNWGNAWDFFWTEEPLPAVDNSDRVELLRSGSEELKAVEDEVREALLASNPITSAIEHFDRLDWFILRADDGKIATVMGSTQEEGMSFEGLGTIPDYRGHGYGGATMVGAVNLSLEHVSHVQFGVWSWNEGAMRLYRRLGIHHDGGMIIGREEPFENLQDMP